MERTKRLWASVEQENLFKHNRRFLFKFGMALESYLDNNDNKNKELIVEAWKKYDHLPKEDSSVSNEELLKSTNQLVQYYMELASKLGNENFIFYEDGDVNYIWKK